MLAHPGEIKNQAARTHRIFPAILFIIAHALADILDGIIHPPLFPEGIRIPIQQPLGTAAVDAEILAGFIFG